jgi:hypothetical protein
MPVDQHGLLEPTPQMQAGLPHLIDDLGNRHARGEVVARHRDRDAVRVQAARELTERGRLQRSEPAAVDKHRQRRVLPLFGKEQVDSLPRAPSVGEAERGTPVGRGLRPIGGGLPCPSCEMLRPFRDAGTVVVLDFIINGGGVVHACLSIDPDRSRWCGCRARCPHESPMPLAYPPAE